MYFKTLYNRATSTENAKNVLSYFLGLLFSFSFLLALFGHNYNQPLKADAKPKLTSLKQTEIKNEHEVFGFAPYWNIGKLDNVNFSVLTTLAYFGLPIDANGNISTENSGYDVFNSSKATEVFKKAHDNGTRVVLTVTQMNNNVILSFLDNPEAQDNAITTIVETVKKRGIDGVNVDYEYIGDAGPDYRNKFSEFVEKLSNKMHQELPFSKVTVSVYASAAKYPKIYDIQRLSNVSDGIFMMAYDFATTGSDQVIPTAPLYGHKEGKYWYDISTAVEDFLTVMPKEKLILGLPWYGYNYPVNQPEVKATKNSGYYTSYWYRGRKYSRFIARPRAYAATYSAALNSTVEMEGWDEYGQVGWRAYRQNDGWRMYFLDDTKSLSIKYDFALQKKLGGVGIWALGFDHGKSDMWNLLSLKFGKKLVDNRIVSRPIYE